MAMTAHRRFIKAHRSPPTLLAVFSNCNFLIISMAAFLILCLLGFHFISFPFFSSADIRHHRTVSQNNIPTTPSHFAAPQDVQKACKATRFPDFCANSLSQYPRSVSDPSQILNSAISISADNLKTAQDMVRRILDSAAGKPGRNAAARNCLEVLDDSAYRIRSAVDALPRGKTKDARAWLSAALLYQYDCWSALKYANDTALVNETMSLLDSLTMLTSNSLGMLVSYDLYGSDVGSWRLPATERDGFWEPGPFSGSGQDFTAGFPANLAADVMVCKDEVGGCSYSKVQDAVDTAPSNGARRFVIRIRAGIYRETVRISLDKKNVVFVGDGVGKTIITGSLNVGQPGIWTYNTATVAVLGDGFMASGITFENTAGPNAHQAVAFRSDGDFTYIENCEFLGNQDTLYAHSLRQYYKSCKIEGNVDFIFGNSATFFQDCQILVRPRQLKPEKGESNAIAAHGRIDPSQSTGFVFQNCLINGTEEYMKLYYQKPAVHKNFLGRPWKEYSRTVFIECNLEALISPLGWMPWKGDFALKTLYYGEFKNSGAGSATSQRVSWSSQIPAEHLESYSATRFLQGDEWIPASS